MNPYSIGKTHKYLRAILPLLFLTKAKCNLCRLVPKVQTDGNGMQNVMWCLEIETVPRISLRITHYVGFDNFWTVIFTSCA